MVMVSIKKKLLNSGPYKRTIIIRRNFGQPPLGADLDLQQWVLHKAPTSLPEEAKDAYQVIEIRDYLMNFNVLNCIWQT
jgi:hypothetical protein